MEQEHNPFPEKEIPSIKRALTPEEQKEFPEQPEAGSSSNEDSFFESLFHADTLQMNREFLPEEEKAAILSSLLTRIRRRRVRKVWLTAVSSAAAIFLLAIVSVSLLRQYRESWLLSQPPVVAATTDVEIIPDEVVVISGQQTITLANNANLEITGNSKAVATDSSRAKQELTLEPATINSLVVPYGKSSTLTLADGTKVWLNAGTRVDFPSRFTGSTREIKVRGEIYLEVAHDPSLPFVVTTDKLAVQVFGTAFNVSAFGGDTVHSVVLVNGSVEVRTSGYSTRLEPGEKIDVSNTNFIKESVDVAGYISWTKGVFLFKATPINEILKKVGRYYNVNFVVAGDVNIQEKTWSGKLLLSENPENVMASISSILSLQYHRENNTIFLKNKTESL